MNFFCPLIKDTCRPDCVFYISYGPKSSDTNCRLDTIAVNLDYIGGIIASKEDDVRDDHE